MRTRICARAGGAEARHSRGSEPKGGRLCFRDRDRHLPKLHRGAMPPRRSRGDTSSSLRYCGLAGFQSIKVLIDVKLSKNKTLNIQGRTGGRAEARCSPDPPHSGIGPWLPEAEGRDRKKGRPERSEGNALNFFFNNNHSFPTNLILNYQLLFLSDYLDFSCYYCIILYG